MKPETSIVITQCPKCGDSVGVEDVCRRCDHFVDVDRQDGGVHVLCSYDESKKKRYYLCDCCQDDDDPDDEAIYVCKKCGRQICNCCVINLNVGDEIPVIDASEHIIDKRYCPFCSKEAASHANL